jgi:hypothetical protein
MFFHGLGVYLPVYRSITAVPGEEAIRSSTLRGGHSHTSDTSPNLQLACTSTPALLDRTPKSRVAGTGVRILPLSVPAHYETNCSFLRIALRDTVRQEEAKS